MTPPIFEIQEETKIRLFNFLQSHGYRVEPKGEKRKTENGSEQYWSVLCSDKEVFWFSSAHLNNEKQIIIFGQLKDKKHRAVCDLLIDEIPKLGGTRIKKLEDYL